MIVKIALLQLLPESGRGGQLKKGIAACEKAKDMGADIALFPEMWSNGYALPQNEDELTALALDADGDFARAFAKLAGELEMAIGITFLEKRKPKPLNSLILFDRKGKKRLHYSKVHTCGFDKERVLAPGDGFHVTELNIGKGSLKVGAMILLRSDICFASVIAAQFKGE